MRVTAAVCAVLLLVQPAFGQTLPGTAESIEVLLVEVPVTVVDRNGEPVRDLKSSNFEIIDQGQKRQITHFDVIDFAASVREERNVSSIPAAARRNFLVLFDLTHTGPAGLTRSREAALQFVRNQVVPGDRVAVATISTMQGFRLLSSFTTDRELTSLAINTMGLPKYFHPADPLLLTVRDLNREADEVETLGSRFAGEIAAQIREFAERTQRASNDEKKQMIARELESFTELGRVLDRVQGRKQVILMSEGFDARMIHGREELNSDEARREQQLAETGSFYRVDTDNRYGSSQTMSLLSQMSTSLRRSDVILHAVDVKGIRTNIDASEGVQRSSNESLFLLTRDTGGEVFEHSNDLSKNFNRLLKSQEVTYILGFQAPTKTPGKFHELKVKLVDVPGGRATARAGYYEPSGATSALDRTLTAGEIIMNRMHVNDVTFKAIAAPFPRPDGQADVPVILEIDGKGLIDAKEKAAGAEILIYAFDEKDVIRDFVVQRVSFDLSKLRDRLIEKGVKFYHTLRLDPGTYSIRTLVRTGGGRNGFQMITLRIPLARETYVATPLIVDSTSGWVMVKAPERGGTGPYPFTLGQDTFVPSAGPKMEADGVYNVALMTWNLPLENLNVLASAADPSGVTHPVSLSMLGRTATEASGRTTLVLQVKPTQLTAGRYSLTFNLAQKGSANPWTVRLPVEVQ